MMATDLIAARVIAAAIAMTLTSFGPTTTVTPLKPDNIQIKKAGEALVFGRIRLMLKGKDQHAGLRYPRRLNGGFRGDPKGRVS